MPVATRRAPTPMAPPPGVNFGSLSFYSGGFQLPPGKYAMEHLVMMHQPTKQDGTAVGQPRLGIMLLAHSLDKPGSDPFEQFLSLGSKTDQSFAPGPDGKTLVAVPGGPASGAPKITNWGLYLKSLYDAGLPPNVFENDITTLDGIWVVTDLVPEPEERKGFAAKTGEAEEERRGSGKTVVVTEILDGGKPWEGTGGIPDATMPAPAAAPKAAPKAAAPRTAARPAARPVAVAPPAPAETSGDDVETAAVNGVSAVLSEAANANGCTKVKLRMGVFKAVTAAQGPEMSQSVMEAYFSDDEALNSLLGAVGFKVNGMNVVAA